MRFYRRRDPQDIIIPVYLAGVFAGDQIQQLGDIKYIYYPDNNRYVQAPGVYAESSGGTITSQPGQAILTIHTEYSDAYYYFSLTYDSTLSQTIEAVQGNYYFVIPSNSAFVALDNGLIVATLQDAQPTSTISSTAQSVLFRSMYGLNLQLQ